MKSFVLRSSFVMYALCFIVLLLSSLFGRAMPTDRLVYLSGSLGESKLYAIDIHRGLTHKLNNTELSSYVMSPDGQEIAYQDTVNDQPAIFIMNPDGRNKRQLIEQPTTYAPAWSPDSQYIAFVIYSQGNTQIYQTKRDGTDLKMLTHLLLPGEGNGLPLWSSDGKRIFFQSQTPINNFNSYIMNADGSDLQQVTYPENFEITDAKASWSPDSRYLAFLGQSIENESRNRKSILCLLDLSSGESRCFADNAYYNFAWSPDGQHIAYVASGGYAIYNLELLNIETGETQRILRYSEITPGQTNWFDYVMWTPDGNALVYELSVSNNRDEAQLYIINADGSGERKLTDGTSGAYAAAWWPDD